MSPSERPHSQSSSQPIVGKAVVVGSGRMSAGVARALRGACHRVVIAGRTPPRVQAAAGAAGVAGAPLERRTFADAELVIETIVETLDAKHELLRRIEPWIASDSLVATNTSSLTLAELAPALTRAERLVGLHFLYPAEATRVVEVTRGATTSDSAYERALAVVEAAGRIALRVRHDIPGWVWNRLQLALLREALHIVEEDIADPATVDQAVEQGLAARWAATGPLASAELGGGEVFETIARRLFPLLDCSHEPPAKLRDGYRSLGPEARAAALRRRELVAAAIDGALAR